MSRYVEHEKRRERILAEATRVFIEDGYQGATYQKIAQRCGVSRTTLYQYFRNKQQIFQYSIKQATDLLAQEYTPLIRQKDLSSLEKLERLMEQVIRGCFEYRDILVILFDYLQWLKKQGEDPRERVHRRTIRLKLTVVRLINKASAEGSISEKDAGAVAELFFAIMEASLLRMVLGYTKEPEKSLGILKTVIAELQTE